MNFPFFIARRYLFAKKSHNAINIISVISVLGVAVATLALVCTLSVFNGFQGLVGQLFTTFDPELKIVPAKGKTFDLEAPEVQKARKNPNVAVSTASLEDRALARYNGRQAMIVLKGVEDNFAQCTDINGILYPGGRFMVHADILQYGIPGMQLARSLGLDANFTDPLQIYTPTQGAKVNLMAPDESFNMDELNSAGVVFNVGQKKYDREYVLCSLQFAQEMFEKEGLASSLEIKVKDGADILQTKSSLQEDLGSNYLVKDQYEQQEDVFRIMKIEKYMAYIFLTFILFIACFNIIGSLSMLIIEKKKDIATLRNLGANDKQIQSIFLFEGRLISLFGAIIGIVLGLTLCLLQQECGILKLGNKEGGFIVDAYPVLVNPWDIVIIFVTVVAVSFLVSWYPVRYISKRLFKKN